MFKIKLLGAWALLLASLLGFAYLYPRWLLSLWPPESPWSSYFYTYGFALIYTGSGLLIALGSGACQWQRPRDRYWFKMVVLGFFYFFCLHGAWILLALKIPYRGES